MVRVCVDLLPRIVDVEGSTRRTGSAQLVMKRLRRERGQKGGGGGVRRENSQRRDVEGCLMVAAGLEGWWLLLGFTGVQ